MWQKFHSLARICASTKEATLHQMDSFSMELITYKRVKRGGSLKALCTNRAKTNKKTYLDLLVLFYY